MTRRFVLPALLGVLLGAGVCGLLLAVDAGAQETTTTTESTTTTSEPTTTTTTPPTTTTTTTAPPPAEPSHADPLGDPAATAWLARLVAFALGVVIAR